jgi:hypothetical protein
VFFSNPEDPGLHGRVGAVHLPTLEPPIRSAFRRPL